MTESTATFDLKSINGHLCHLRHLCHLAFSSPPSVHSLRGTRTLRTSRASQASSALKASSAPKAPQARNVTPRQIRSLQIHLARILHVANQVAAIYSDEVQRYNKRTVTVLSADPLKAIDSKQLALLLSIQEFVSRHGIPVRHWFRAQFDLCKVPKSMSHIPINMCHGPNAFQRYETWNRRQSKRFIRTEDRTRILDTSFTSEVANSIRLSHQFAVAELSNPARVFPPSQAGALWELFPEVSAWYLVAHDEFRVKYLESGACLASSIVKHYQQYKSNRKIREACNRALLQAIDQLGDLPCILSHSVQV